MAADGDGAVGEQAPVHERRLPGEPPHGHPVAVGDDGVADVAGGGVEHDPVALRRAVARHRPARPLARETARRPPVAERKRLARPQRHGARDAAGGDAHAAARLAGDRVVEDRRVEGGHERRLGDDAAGRGGGRDRRGGGRDRRRGRSRPRAGCAQPHAREHPPPRPQLELGVTRPPDPQRRAHAARPAPKPPHRALPPAGAHAARRRAADEHAACYPPPAHASEAAHAHPRRPAEVRAHSQGRSHGRRSLDQPLGLAPAPPRRRAARGTGRPRVGSSDAIRFADRMLAAE